MKKKILTTLAACTLAAGLAYANAEFIADCEEFETANGVDGDCECMAAAAEEAGVVDELMATETLADLEGLSDEAKAVIKGCSE